MANMYCKKFRENHPNVEFETLEDNSILITNCWNDDSCTFNFKKSSSAFTFFNNLILHEELLAIYHIKEQLYEFIFTPLSSEFLRDFKYIFAGSEYHLYYSKPSKAFEKLALNFRLNDSDGITDRAFAFMRYFQYFSQEKDRGNLYATNFFIKGDFNKLQFAEHLDLFKHVNLLMSYYDRKVPPYIYAIQQMPIHPILMCRAN